MSWVTAPAVVQRYGPAHGFSGLGDCCVTTYDDTGAITNLDCSGCSAPATGGAIPDTFGGTGAGSGGMTIPSSGGGGLTAAQIAQMIAAGGAAASQAFGALNAPPGYMYNSATGQYVRAGTAVGTAPAGFTYNPATGSYVASSTVSVAGIMPLVIGLAGILVLVMVLNK